MCIDYDLRSAEEGQTQEIVYGLANIEAVYSFSARVGNLDAEIYVKPVSTRKGDKQSGVLSAEMTLKNICEDQQISYETYYTWFASLLSFASGRCVDQIYRIETTRNKKSLRRSEYWSGDKLRSKGQGIAVMQSIDLCVFMQQCPQKVTWEIFNNKGVGLALNWYIDTFISTTVEVDFLLLCTVLESLNKKYSKNASKKLIPTLVYRKIRKKILQVLSEIRQEITEDDHLKKYDIFTLKVEKSFGDGSYNQIGNLRTSLKEMLKTYSVPYEDLFPELEFIKVRDEIIHEGFGGVDVALELCKLSDLVVRVFLAILEYQGDYVESRKIEIHDSSGCSKHGLICRPFPLVVPEENTFPTSET